MTARSTPYPEPGYVVRVPASLWSSALQTVRSYGRLDGDGAHRRGSEGLVYFGGVGAGNEMIVTGLYRVQHSPQGDRVVVSPAEVRWLLRTLRARDEKLVAQLHTHRGQAGHSAGDDVRATSFHDGFLSVVVPRFGAGVSRPNECAVLERRASGFVELLATEAEQRVRLYDDVVDRITTSKESPWTAFVRKLKSIGYRLRSRRGH